MPVHALEPRRLFAFATFDASFGTGGLAAVEGAIDADARVTPLADGRLIVSGRSAIRYRRGDGNADGRRATGGTLALAGRVVDVAVDAATGRSAVLRDLGRSDAGRAFAVDLYDARGRLDATRAVASRANGAPAALAFDATTGGVVVATDRAVADGPGTVARRAVLWRLTDDLTIDAQFGDGGRAAIDWASDVDASLGERGAIDLLAVDHVGRPHLVASTRRLGSDGIRSEAYVHRVTASGGPDRDAGGYARGPRRLRSDPIVGVGGTPGTRDDVDATLGVAVRPDGSTEYLWANAGVRRVNTGLYYSFAIARRQLSRSDGNSSNGWDAVIDYDTAEAVADLRPGGMAIDASGEVFLATLGDAGGATTTFRKIDARQQHVPGSTFARESIVPIESSSLAADRDGRLVGAGVVADFSGRRRLVIYALADAETADAVGADVRAGDATIAADGVVRVRGTAANDLIVVRAEGRDLLIEVNDDVRRFPLDDVRAVAVAAGRGDDYVEVAAALPGVRVAGEAGDDTLIGGNGADTLSGGSGADRIDGRAGDDRLTGDAGADDVAGDLGDDLIRGGDGNDQLAGGAGDDALYGESDKDVLLGGDGGDWLMGNTGNDRLYASGVVDSAGVSDGAADTLVGLAGLDYLRVDAGGDDLYTLDAYQDTLASA